MAQPSMIHKKRFQLPVKMANPIAVMWNNNTLVLDANSKNLWNVVFIKMHVTWIKKETRGNVPGHIYFSDYTAQVIQDKMYVHVFNFGIFRAIYCLDLNNWTWTKMTPGGPSPPLDQDGGGLSSWVYKEKMYHYVEDELFCYNISKNIWEWPKIRGEIPTLDGGCVATIVEDTVFLFEAGTLYTLDMETMIWTKVHGELSDKTFGPIKNFSNVTLTKVSLTTAILIGESGNSMVCWLLDLQKAKHLMQPSSMWTKIQLRFPIIYKYAVLQEPQGKELLLIGGRQHGSISKNVLKIQTQLPPLRSLAIDCAARHTCILDSRLLSDQLPLELIEEILLCKLEIFGIESVCNTAAGCTKCNTNKFTCSFPPKKRKRRKL